MSRRGAFFAALGALALGGAPACKKQAAPDAGVVSAPLDAGTMLASPSAPSATVPGPVARDTGPRAASVVDVQRFPDLAALRKEKALAGVARFVEEATRDVYGDKAFEAAVEKATGEALRPPGSLALERLDAGDKPELWRVTYEAWCGKSTGGAAGYKSDHLLLSLAGGEWRLVGSYRPGCEESGEPEVILLDLDGDGREEVVARYASTKLGAENRLELRELRRQAQGFESVPLLRESSPFQTTEIRYAPSPAGGRELLFRTFREDKTDCNFFEVSVSYRLERQKGVFVRGQETLRPVPPKTLADEGEDVDERCEKP